jgi:hypothetical protein
MPARRRRNSQHALMSQKGGLVAVRRDPKWMLLVSTNEVFDVSQALGKRLRLPPPLVIDEPKSSEPKGAYLCPLFVVRLPGNLECPSHPVKFAAAFRAFCAGCLRQLPRLPAVEAGVRPEACRPAMVGRRRRLGPLPVTQRSPPFHSLRFGRCCRHGAIMRWARKIR